MREDEVADRVGALDVVLVAGERGEEPRIFFGYEIFGLVVGPQDILVVGMEVYAGLLGVHPFGRDG